MRLTDEWFTFLPAGSVEPIRRDLGLTYGQIGAILALIPLAGGLVGGLFAIAADRVSRRALAAGGALGCAAGMACWAGGQGFVALAAGSMLLAMGSDALVSACEVALVDLAGDDLVATLAPGTLAAEIGDLLGPLLIAGTAALGWSWRVPFVFAAVVFAGYGLVLAAQPIPRPAATSTGGIEPTPRCSLACGIGECGRSPPSRSCSTPWTSRSSPSPSPTSRWTEGSPTSSQSWSGPASSSAASSARPAWCCTRAAVVIRPRSRRW